jgi:hypothetical protein
MTGETSRRRRAAFAGRYEPAAPTSKSGPGPRLRQGTVQRRDGRSKLMMRQRSERIPARCQPLPREGLRGLCCLADVSDSKGPLVVADDSACACRRTAPAIQARMSWSFAVSARWLDSNTRFYVVHADYEIDLSTKNARRFRKQLTPFIDHAPRLSRAVPWSRARAGGAAGRCGGGRASARSPRV